jgi:hypothetical protein
MKHAEQTITDLETRLQELEVESRKIKSAINCLCDVIGLPPKYQDVEEESKTTNVRRADEYYGRPLATVVTEVLDKRNAQGLGAATLDEIYDHLVAGGFDFTGKNDGIKKRGLSISMSKNRKFHRLPNDTWGLVSWYPSAKEVKENGNKAAAQAEQEENESTEGTISNSEEPVDYNALLDDDSSQESQKESPAG